MEQNNVHDGWGQDGRRGRATMRMACALASAAHIEPPEIGDALRHLLDILPPFVSRKDVSRLLGVPIGAGAMRNLDAQGKGPRMSKKDTVSGVVLYPAPYLLEWIEKRGFVTLAAERI